VIDKIAHNDTFKVGLVAAVCILVIVFVTTQVLHVGAELAVMGPIILFLGYLVSSGWTPVDEWNPVLYWSAAIILTALVELAFAYVGQ
jgi:hypothetical protein